MTPPALMADFTLLEAWQKAMAVVDSYIVELEEALRVVWTHLPVTEVCLLEEQSPKVFALVTDLCDEDS